MLPQCSTILAAVALCVLACTAFAVDPKVRKNVRHEDSSVRADAARTLGKDGSPAAVKLLRTLLKDESPYVRDVAVFVCKDLSDPKSVAVLSSLTRVRDPLVRWNAVAALGRTKSPAATEILTSVARHDKNAGVRAGAVFAARGLPSDAAVVALLEHGLADRSPSVRSSALLAAESLRPARAAEYARLAYDDRDEGVRCTARQVLRQIDPAEAGRRIGGFGKGDGWRVRVQAVEDSLFLRDVASMTMLIGQLDHPRPVVSTKAHRALRRLSRKNIGKERDLWEAWWAQNRGEWQNPTGNLPTVKVVASREKTAARYHGIEIDTDHVGFVIDLSGSMTDRMDGSNSKWTRWGIARYHLRKALKMLRRGTRVNVILFHERVRQVFDKSQPLDDRVRKQVETFLKRTGPGGQTNVYSALSAVLALDDVDTVFFLTDGAPNFGDTTSRTRLTWWFWRENQRRKLTIHTVSLGAKSHGKKLLKDLAKQNGGRYISY